MNQQALDIIETIAQKYDGLVTIYPELGEVDVNGIPWHFANSLKMNLPQNGTVAREITDALLAIKCGDFVVKNDVSTRVTIKFLEEVVSTK